MNNKVLLWVQTPFLHGLVAQTSTICVQLAPEYPKLQTLYLFIFKFLIKI